ncbi:MAG: porin family protein [Bacteroidales bacterium]|nr:PorT family protein [Bacteroidales bacterium]MDD4603546.1 porin family protein [Bacteroidales bacterium]
MKKLFFFVLVFLTAEMTFGQFTVGIKVGYDAAKLSTNIDSIKTNFQSGFQIGAFVRIGKRVYLQPELYYTTTGGVFTSNMTNWKQNVKIGSMDVPLLIGCKIINSDFLNLRILAGPMASFVVNKSVSDAGGVSGPITSSDLNTVNWAIQAGAGMDIWKLTLDVRYQVGLNQLIKSVQNYTFNSYNNIWVVSLGFKIL